MSDCQNDLDHWLALIRAEYLEMPGLSLTRLQAQRLWGLDLSACEVLLKTLESDHFLHRTAKEVFVRSRG